MSVVANVAINVDSRNAVSKLREMQSQAATTERAFNGVAAAAGKLAIAFGALQAAKFVFAKTAELESQTRSLEVLTGSAQKAGQIIKELQQLGAVTPFTSTELIDSAKRLQAFGVEADKVVETTKRLADVSGATGAELQGLVTAYGQVQAKGRLQGEELLQFQERGVALQAELRKMYGLSGEEFQKALEKGRIGSEAVEVAIKHLTEAGGKYANGAIAQSDTLQGKLSTLQDSFEQLARNIGTYFTPVFKFLIDGVNAFLERLNSAQRLGAEARANEQANIRTKNRFGLRAINPFDTEAQQYRERLRQSLVSAEMGSMRGGGPLAPTPAGAPPLLGATVGGGGGGGGGDAGGAKKGKTDAEREAKRLAEQIAEQKASAADLLFTEQNRLTVAQTADPLHRQITEAITKQAEIQREYTQKLNEAKSAEETLNLQLAQQTALQANALELERALAEEVNNLEQPLQAIFKESKAKLELENRYQKLLTDGINPELAKEFAQLELTAEKQTQLLTLRVAELEAAKAKLSAESDVAKALQSQIDSIKEILKLQGQAVNQSKQETEEEKNKREEREKRDKAAKDQAERLKALYGGIVDTIQDGIVDALTTGIEGLIRGTKTLSDSLKEIAAGILKDIGQELLRFGIKAAFQSIAPAKEGAYWPGGFQAFANGGVVTSPTMGLIGEGGEPEYVIPASKMRGAMNRYAAGARGASVIPGAGGGGGGPMGGGGGGAIDVRYTVERINSVDYVTADQFQRGMAQAAQQGAAQGEQRAMRSLKTSAATRRSVGI